MDSLIQKMCARYVHDSLVITRNTESQDLLRKLGIPTELGTDTAWTFEPHPPEYARKTLREAGWDEKTPVLVLCPIHPFVWPVKASLAKYAARITTGAYKESQYRTVYFHESGAEVDRKFRHYISGFGKAAAAFCQRHRVFPILVAMERLDAVACRSMSEFLPNTPIFTSDDYDMFQLISILRARLVHGFVALPRHRHLHAQPGCVRWRHHGRAHPQPDARARSPASCSSPSKIRTWSRKLCR